MKTLILAIALVAKTDAPEAELHEVAAASAAVASVQVVPEAHSSPLAATDTPTLREAWASVAAVAPERIVPEAGRGRIVVADTPTLREAGASVAAVATERIVPEAGRGRIAVADTPTLHEAGASVAAKSGECQLCEVGTGEPCALRASVSLKTAPAAPVAEPRRLATLPEPKVGTECDVVSLFETRRFLSAPWSASRRLKAARLRGDEDEARRMEARLGELVEEALGVEEEGADDD